MILSMTGFGRAVVENATKRFTVEIKSLNSKQLDLSTRVPAPYREVELDLRNAIGRRLERGKIDLSVYVESVNGESIASFNIPVMAAYKAEFEKMASELNLPQPDDWYSLLLRFPDTLRSDAMTTVSDDEVAALTDAVGQAVEALMQFRAKEGSKLQEFFTLRINAISSLLAEVPNYENERITRIKARIEDGLAKINPVDYDKGRLEQEMIFYIEKLDINEEKQRLAQHLNYFMETMQGAPGQGKKLGFISQEMGREINTLGSKSNHAEMQKLVVRMKDVLEQIKEQVLNVM